jgi:hypothetical protein
MIRIKPKRAVVVLLFVAALATFFLSSLLVSHPSIGNDEVIPPDEDGKIAGIVSSSIRLSELYRPPNEYHRRDVHTKAHGCVKARFVVPNLDAKYRQGLFAHAGEYKAWIRFSSGDSRIQSDGVKDARGMAVKVMGVPGEKLLPDEKDADTQDFVMINNRVFFIRDVDDYAEFATRLSHGDRYGFFFSGGVLTPWHWHLRELWLAMQTLKKPPVSPLAAEYDSLSAYKLGQMQTIKFGTRPCDPGRPSHAGSGPNALRAALKADLTSGSACFDFVVQLQRADRNMPVEDTTVLWSEADSPFAKVARVEIPSQEFDTPEQDQFCEGLSFTPWHALPEHRPLGIMNRLRKAVYVAVSRYRRAKNGVPFQEPFGYCLDLTGKTCPASGS